MRINYISESSHNEWYTPVFIVDCCRFVLGSIDFDPFSSELANQTVKAASFLTKDDDAFISEWKTGTCFINPPYQRKIIQQSIKYTIKHFENKENSGIVLVNVDSGTTWFHSLLLHANAVCFLRGRLKFIDGNGIKNSAGNTRSQALFYFGENADLFIQMFSLHGTSIKL